MNKKLVEEISKLREKEIALVICSQANVPETNTDLLKLIAENGSHAIALSITHPYESLEKELGKLSKKFFFIDCISRSGGLEERGENHLCVDNPARLTEIGIAITEGFKALPEGKKFLFVDAISGLSVYTNKSVFSNFSRFLTGKTREFGACGVIVSVANAMDNDMQSQLAQFCDKVIDISKGEE